MQALVFDCDGTLVDSAPLYQRAWSQAVAQSGHVLEARWYHAHFGLSEDGMLDRYEREFGVRLDRPRVVAGARAAFRALLPQLRVIEPVAALVRAAHGKLPLAVASGGPRELVHAELRQVGLAPSFAAIVTIDDVGLPKPHPQVFLEAARRIGVPAARCVAIEDSDTGLASARAAAMRCVDIREPGALERLVRLPGWS